MSLVRLNDRNDVVKSLQRLLKDKGYNIYPDGIFGKKTEQAVRLFQQKNGLHADGIVGRKTWAALGKKLPHHRLLHQLWVRRDVKIPVR